MVAFWAAALCVCAVYGEHVLSAPDRGGEQLRIGVVQANADKHVKRNSTSAKTLLDVHLELSRHLGDCDLIVWPETAVPMTIEESPTLKKCLSDLAREKRAYLLFGSLGTTGTKIHNSVFLVSPSGEFLQRYDKVHLVPFGEYIPLRGILEPLVKNKVHNKVPFAPGSETTVFHVKDIPLAALVCYEDVFSDLAARASGAGARLLVNMTSEGWFGDDGEQEQHLAIAQMMAIQHRLPMVRVANTGISAFIDPKGRIHSSEALSLGKAGVAVLTVSVP